ncbi:MAG: hypothetical protein IAF02_18080 [Anaerolineae bacterium]|nr:hypothetical protein [Anaerolineae bacterium]
MSIATFFVTTPYVILDYQTFLEGIQFNAEHYATGHAGMEGNTFCWYLSFLWRVEGIVFILAVIEIIRGIFARSKVTLFIAVFPIIYFIFINGFIVRNDRTILPTLPFVVLLAANLLVWGFEKLSKQEKSYKTAGLLVGVALIMLIAFFVPLQRSIRNTMKLMTVDSRETARVWIADNLPEESKIAVESYVPYMDRARFPIESMYNLQEKPFEWYQENEIDYLIFSEGAYGRFFREPVRYKDQIAAYEALWSQLRLEKMFDDGDFEVRIYAFPQPPPQ